ncbi:hypothetical protein OnM2_096033 [Erysiphe neolycopersici]|uniref:Uncharacterized protein n=1 Tax=Erysiphe neolycopersici TaxID=212602 RepID=A0A420HAS6_9PEZI|nr:hypothetical protein OnM2_096033 [Erysiphe neolycopersici]
MITFTAWASDVERYDIKIHVPHDSQIQIEQDSAKEGCELVRRYPLSAQANQCFQSLSHSRPATVSPTMN